MSVVRVHKTSNYTVMSNNHFKEKDMSLKAKGLLSLMLSLPDDWNYSISGLVTLSKDGKDSVMSALSELEQFGYLVRNRTINSKGQFNGIEYHIYEIPQTEKAVAENPILDKQHAEKSNSENPPQLNTKLTKEKNNKINNELNTKGEELEEVLETISNKELRETYRDYIEMRENIKSPITKRGLKMLIDRCERMSNFKVNVQKLLLETAIINNWKNVYMPKEDEVHNANKDVLDELKRFYLD